MNKNKIIECVFGDELFSNNFCYFDKPMFEYTLEQKIKLINDRYSVFEQKKIIELYYLYKDIDLNNLPIEIVCHIKAGYYEIKVKGKPIKKTFDYLEEAKKYAKTYYPRLILNKKHLIF